MAAPPSTTVNSTCMPSVKCGGPSVPVGALPSGAEPAAAIIWSMASWVVPLGMKHSPM